MSGGKKSRKHDRNREFCKGYKARDVENANRRARHRTIVNRLEKKRSRMQMKGRDVEGISRAIQHHDSLSRR